MAAFDFERAKRDAVSGIIAAAVIGVGLLFTVLMGCAAVIAVTWDTPHRLAAIAWMGGAFLAIAVIAMIYASRIAAGQAPFLDTVRREWKEDSVILERILADDEKMKPRRLLGNAMRFSRGLPRAERKSAGLLEPPPEAGRGDGEPGPAGSAGGFPRSRTMQALMSGRGLGAMGAMAGGLLLARPRLAWRLLRLLPTSAVTRMVVARVRGRDAGQGIDSLTPS